MGAGLPVVTTAVGGNVEVIEDKVNGILVDYNDREMLAEAMKFLLRNKEARERLAKAAAETASEFTTAKMMEQLARLLANPNI